MNTPSSPENKPIEKGSPRLRTREAAAYVGLSYSTLTKLRLSGNGPRFCKLGAAVVYDRADLDDWLEGTKHLSTSEYLGASQ